MPYVIHDTTGISYRDADGEADARAPQRRVGHAARAAAVRRESSRYVDRITASCSRPLHDR